MHLSSFYVVVVLVQIVTFSTPEFLSLQEINHILTLFFLMYNYRVISSRNGDVITERVVSKTEHNLNCCLFTTGIDHPDGSFLRQTCFPEWHGYMGSSLQFLLSGPQFARI